MRCSDPHILHSAAQLLDSDCIAIVLGTSLATRWQVLRYRGFEPLKVCRAIVIIRVIVQKFEFFACLNILLKLGLSRRILPVLKVDDVENVSPRALIAIDALG